MLFAVVAEWDDRYRLTLALPGCSCADRDGHPLYHRSLRPGRGVRSQASNRLPAVPGQVGVGGERVQPAVLDRRAHREVVEHLEAVAGQAEQAVRFLVEVAADARAAQARRLGLQVERL